MKPEKNSKKSDAIKFRVPWTLKRDFMAKARREGRSASDIFRDLMEEYLQRPAQRKTTQTLETAMTAMTAIRKRPRMSFAAVLGAAGISAVLAGAIPAAATPDLRAQFMRLDANGDGVVTVEEMAPGAGVQEFRIERRTGGELGIVLSPSDRAGGGVAEFRMGPDGAPVPRLERIGPILLPATGPDGEKRVMMLQTMRQHDDAGQNLMELTGPALLADEFRAGDADGDGALSFDEFEARYSAVRTKSFDALDTDGDGVISAAEIEDNPVDGPGNDMAANALHGVDANGDGRVTRAEYEDVV